MQLQIWPSVDKLQQAVKIATRLARLKESGNITYIEYATTLENAIKNLEKYSVAVARVSLTIKVLKPSNKSQAKGRGVVCERIEGRIRKTTRSNRGS